jgi:glycosyltransferase involved in cell wall biosynthesis
MFLERAFRRMGTCSRSDAPRAFLEVVPAAFDGGMGMLAREDYLALPANLASARGWKTTVTSLPGGLDGVALSGARVLSPEAAIVTVHGWIPYLTLLWRHRHSVVYANYRTPMSLAAGLFGRRRIFMAHLSNPPRSWLQRAVLGRLLRRFHVVRVANEYEYDEMRKLGVPNERLALIPYVVDWQLFARRVAPNEIDEVRIKYGLVAGDKVALCLSNVRRVKRVDTVLRAVAELRRDGIPLKLIVAGEDRLHLEGLTSLREQARDLGIEEGLIRAGFVVPEELPALFVVADVFVHSAEAEGQCLAVYEAAAAGVPLCLSTIGSFTRVFSRAKFHAPGDHEQLATNVRRVLEGPSAPDDLECHRQVVRERCDEHRIHRLLEKILDPSS